MEREDVPLVLRTRPDETAPTYTEIVGTRVVQVHPEVGVMKAHAHYRCDGCDSEWLWTRGEGTGPGTGRGVNEEHGRRVPTLRMLDGADYDPAGAWAQGGR